MKKYLVLLWLLLPLPLVVLHFGRGQQWLARDRAHTIVTRAQAAEQKEDWQQADALYREAAGIVATDNKELKLRLDLAQVRTRQRTGDALGAIEGADRLLEDNHLATMPEDFRREAREVAARIHYYAAWVMRLEGAERSLWMEEAELSRQNFRLLAEQSAQSAPATYLAKQQENLESAVQLQRLGLTELMARPLPKEGQCMGNQCLTEKMGQKKKKKGKQSGKGPPQKGAGLRRYEPGAGS